MRLKAKQTNKHINCNTNEALVETRAGNWRETQAGKQAGRQAGK